MSDRPIPRQMLNDLTSHCMPLLSVIGHLQGIEKATACPCARPYVRHPTASDNDLQVYEGCHGTGHHAT
jgi:hypothetical protein